MATRLHAMRQRVIALGFGLVFAASVTSVGSGAEGGGSTYAIGAATINPGLEPSPPGFTFLNYNQFYTASHLRNLRGADAIPAYRLTSEVSSFRFDYTLPDRFFPQGVRVGVQLIQPVFNSEVYTRVGTAQGQKHSGAGLGDTTFVPLVVGYKGTTVGLGDYALKFRLLITAPTGAYDVTQVVNRGRNYFSYDPQIGIQYFPRPDLTVGANLTYTFNEINGKTNYKSGSEFIAEYIADYSPVKDLWVGIGGYAYRQTTADLKNGAEFQDGHFGSAFAVGPQVRYTTRFGSITAKWQHEMLVRNRPDGERFWLQLFVPL